MQFLIVGVVLCIAAGLFIQRNRERAGNAPLRSQIQAQVCFETSLGRACTLGTGGFGGTRGVWISIRGRARLTVGADAFVISAPQALREYAFTGPETSITLAQMRFGPAGRDWIVITGLSGGRQVQMAIMPDNLPDTWNALAGTGAALVPTMAAAVPQQRRMSRWLDRRPLWQYALICWTTTTAGCMVAITAVEVWRGDGVHGYGWFEAALFATGNTVLAVKLRQRHGLCTLAAGPQTSHRIMSRDRPTFHVRWRACSAGAAVGDDRREALLDLGDPVGVGER